MADEDLGRLLDECLQVRKQLRAVRLSLQELREHIDAAIDEARTEPSPRNDLSLHGAPVSTTTDAPKAAPVAPPR